MAAPPLMFKLLTLNTHKGFNSFNRTFVLHELREVVRKEAADLVFLQEVLGSHQKHAERVPTWPQAPQYEFLADSIWQDFAYGRNAVYSDGHHGNALLSKFPIVRFENHDVSIGTQEQRGLLHCVLRIPGRDLEVHAICVHLGLREAHRRRQTDRLCALIDEAVPDHAPLLVVGDFNDLWQRASARLQRCGLHEAFMTEYGHLARSFPVRWPLLKLDRIYYRNVRITRPQVLSAGPWARLSDHAALSAEVHV